MKKHIRIGSRSSLLAVAQTNILIEQLREAYPETEFELVTMKTTGDINMKPFSDSSDKLGIKGLFTKELEEALENETIDLAVHSLKDVPMAANEELPIVAYSAREDARDVAVFPEGSKYDGGTIGCSSARRHLQLADLFPCTPVMPVRGNIITRLRKLDEGEFSMLILAAAGLKRAKLENRISRYFSPDEVVPAPGQGVLACQGKAGRDYSWLDAIRDKETELCVRAERTFAALLGGGCTSPVGAYAEADGEKLTLRGFYQSEKTGECHKATHAGNINEPEKLARQLAKIISQGELQI